jgi:CMP-N,N'-diacetyllegionaminic acid synthase
MENLELPILGIIPARGGSKRIERKNEKLLAGKPLLAWSIEAAQDLEFVKVMVSTDDGIIAKIATGLGAEVPFLRSKKYASDEANIVDAVIEVLEFYEREGLFFQAVLLLQPTSPFRTKESIREAVSLHKNSQFESVVSVNRARTHPYWCKKIEHGVLVPFNQSYDGVKLRSQDLPEVYELNGSIYLASVSTLKATKSFYSLNTQALVVSEHESLDIDTPYDWLQAVTRAKMVLEK